MQKNLKKLIRLSQLQNKLYLHSIISSNPSFVKFSLKVRHLRCTPKCPRWPHRHPTRLQLEYQIPPCGVSWDLQRSELQRNAGGEEEKMPNTVLLYA